MTDAILREILVKATHVSTSVAVLLSNGVDSNSILAAILRNGIRPTVISFRIARNVSTDWSAARATARALNLDFVDIELPTDLDVMHADVQHAIRYLGLRKKTDIECAIPVRYALDAAKQKNIATVISGLGADGHFGLSRKAVIRAHTGDGLDNPEWLDSFRESYFAQTNPAQTQTMTRYADAIGIQMLAPYINQQIVDLFRGVSWRALHTPQQKMPTRRAFPEIAQWRVGRSHINLQLGDSGIALNYSRLVKSRYNTRGAKSVVAIYNDIARSACSRPM